jgi:hypothetical protein
MSSGFFYSARRARQAVKAGFWVPLGAISSRFKRHPVAIRTPPTRRATLFLTQAWNFPYNSGLFLNLPAEKAQGEPAKMRGCRQVSCGRFSILISREIQKGQVIFLDQS